MNDTSPNLEKERYEVQSKLGEGGMGDVFSVTDNKLGRQIAVKMLKNGLLDDENSVQRFQQEAKLTGRLEHPGIPPIHDVGVDASGQHYFTMKLVKGLTLAQVISKLRGGDPDTVQQYSYAYRAQLIIALCLAIEFANSNGVFHRDIKPENVMVGEHGEIQLMDWGIATDRGKEAPKIEEGDFVGTVAYAAPERFGEPESAWTTQSEVYSLGALMYELFTLQAPHQGKTVIELLTKVINENPRPPFQVTTPFQTPCPIEYSYVISKAMAKDPKVRIQSARRLAHHIQMALQDEAPVVCPCTAVKYNLRLFDWAIDRLGGLAAVAIFLWFLAPIVLSGLLLYVVLAKPMG